MSADNGIYILGTTLEGGGMEFRVTHAQGIDNIDYNEQTHEYDATEEMRIKEAREYFKNAPVFDTEIEAHNYACELSQDFTILEYGVCFIEIDRTF